MTDQPSIESLRQAVGRIEIPDDQYAIHRALDELERLRLIEAGDRDSEALVTRLLKGSAHTDLEAHDARVRREVWDAFVVIAGRRPLSIITDADGTMLLVGATLDVEPYRAAILGTDPQPSTENTAPREEETK